MKPDWDTAGTQGRCLLVASSSLGSRVMSSTNCSSPELLPRFCTSRFPPPPVTLYPPTPSKEVANPALLLLGAGRGAWQVSSFLQIVLSCQFRKFLIWGRGRHVESLWDRRGGFCLLSWASPDRARVVASGRKQYVGRARSLFPSCATGWLWGRRAKRKESK